MDSATPIHPQRSRDPAVLLPTPPISRKGTPTPSGRGSSAGIIALGNTSGTDESDHDFEFATRRSSQSQPSRRLRKESTISDFSDDTSGTSSSWAAVSDMGDDGGVRSMRESDSEKEIGDGSDVESGNISAVGESEPEEEEKKDRKHANGSRQKQREHASLTPSAEDYRLGVEIPGSFSGFGALGGLERSVDLELGGKEVGKGDGIMSAPLGRQGTIRKRSDVIDLEATGRDDISSMDGGSTLKASPSISTLHSTPHPHPSSLPYQSRSHPDADDIELENLNHQHPATPTFPGNLSLAEHGGSSGHVSPKKNDINLDFDPQDPSDDDARGDFAAAVSGLGSRDEDHTREGEREIPALPPVDGGKDAWLFLVAAFMVETIVWGFPITYGILLTYYLNSPSPFAVSLRSTPSARSLLAIVGPLSSGIMYCSAPTVVLMLNRFRIFRKWGHWIGAVICAVSTVLAGFATKPWQLVLTEGVGYAIGGSFVYYVTTTFIPDWFVQKRGLANGVCFAGTGLGGVVLPFIFQTVLDKWGARTLLISVGLSTFLLLLPFLPYIHGRVPPPPRPSSTNHSVSHPFSSRFRLGPLSRSRRPSTSNTHSHSPTDNDNNRDEDEGGRGRSRKTGMNWIGADPNANLIWKDKSLYLALISNVIQAAAFFLPNLYLPNFAQSMGLGSGAGSAVLVALNASSLCSRLFLGYLSDKVQPRLLASITMVSSALAVFLVWGLAGGEGLAALIGFAVVFGITAGGWTCLWMGIIRDMGVDDPVLSNTLFGLFNFSRGVGNILAGPISTQLLKFGLGSASSELGYGVSGGRFGALILFTGSCFGIVGVSETVEWVQRTRKKRE